MWYRILTAAVVAVGILLAPCSSTTMADAIVSVPDLIPAKGFSIVHVPVNISTVTDMSAFDLLIEYDTVRLDLVSTGVMAGSFLTPDWNVLANVNDSVGMAIVSAYTANKIDGAGEILDLAFHVKHYGGIADINVDTIFAGGYDDQSNPFEIYIIDDNGSVIITTVPEPSTIAVWGLFSTGLGFVALRRRRRRA